MHHSDNLALAVTVLSTINMCFFSHMANASYSPRVTAMRVTGNGVLKTEERQISVFTSVNVRGVYDVEIDSQPTQKLEIIGDENILPVVITEVKDNTLFIYNRIPISTSNKLKVKISARNVQTISTDGATNIKLFDVNNETLSIEQGGSSKTILSGKTKELRIAISGAGDVNGQNLYSQTAKVDISGSGKVDVYATEELKTRIIGAGKINYFGNPKKVIRDIVGVGSLNKK